MSWKTCADEAFFRLFRVDPCCVEEEKALDRLSLLACERQGISVQELMPLAEAEQALLEERRKKVQEAEKSESSDLNGSSRGNPSSENPPERSSPTCEQSPSPARSHSTRSAFRGNEPKIVTLARLEGIEQRRMAKMRIVEKERSKIVDVLTTCHDQQGRLTHAQSTLQAELLRQDERGGGDEAFVAEEERSHVAMLLIRESDAKQHHAKIKEAVQHLHRQGDEEMKRIRDKQLTSIRTTLQLEVEKQKMIADLERKEAALKKEREKRKKELVEQGQEAEQARLEKLDKLQQRSEQRWLQRKHEIELKAQRRNELLASIERSKEADRKRRLKKMEADMEYVKERAKTVKEDQELHSQLLKREIDSKLHLHGKRRQNIDLRLMTAKKTRMVKEEKRFDAVSVHQSHVNDGLDDAKKEQLKALEEAQRRKEDEDRAIRESLISQQRKRDEQFQEAEVRRRQHETAKERRDRELMEERYRREQHVESVKRAKEERRMLRAALEEQKHEHHLDNVERLDRATKFRQKVKDALVEEQIRQMKIQERRKKDLQARMRRTRQVIADEKERLIETFVKIGSSSAHMQVDGDDEGGRSSVDAIMDKFMNTATNNRSNAGNGQQKTQGSPQPASEKRNRHFKDPGDKRRNEANNRSRDEHGKNTPVGDILEKLRPDTAPAAGRK